MVGQAVDRGKGLELLPVKATDAPVGGKPQVALPILQKGFHLLADQAVGAGMDMLHALKELNRDFAKKGWPEIRIGVGVNTGMMSVGNMGSAFRRAYTVLGDAVNLGSRLEGITKAYGVDFIVSETTAQQAGRFVYRELDRVQVKGKEKPVTILEPIGLDEEIDNETRDNVRAFHHFLFLYRNQEWKAALKALHLLRQHQGDCLLFQLYEERIDHFQDNPPGEDWDGVFVHTSK